MAACTAAAVRQGWLRLRIPGLFPPLKGLNAQIHCGSSPTWFHGSIPCGATLRPRCLLRPPPVRGQSTAATVPAQVLPPVVAPAPPPEGTAVPVGELVEVPDLGLVDLKLVDLGLGSNTPVGLIQTLLEKLHIDLGLPWWGAIIAGTVMARILVLPVIVQAQREAAKLNNHLPEITRMSVRMNEARLQGNHFEYAHLASDLSLYQKAHGIHPLRSFIMPVVQAPIFISFFMALRDMAALPVPSMQSGGLAWFVDLTSADPYYALPLIVTTSMWLILEVGAESGVDNANLKTLKTVFRVIPIVILPLTISFPTAIFTYWLTSNLFSLAQVGVLRVPAIRTWLRIPERVRHNPALLPQNEGFLKSLRTGWKKVQLGKQLKDRERRMKDNMGLAAIGPLRQTFSHNPLQPQDAGVSVTNSRPHPAKRPWQDTLG
uniref:OXA1L mitochondrial inner membrane protein n=1 Tax=Pelusios castaneus TaxID=367368 RepID=A0A8C8VI70_9SAUR